MTAAYPISGANFTNLAAAGNTQVKTGPGILFGLSINTGQSGASVTLYDGTSSAGRKIGAFSAAAQGGPVITPAGIAFATGLFAVVAGATPPDVTIAWF